MKIIDAICLLKVNDATKLFYLFTLTLLKKYAIAHLTRDFHEIFYFRV